MIFWLILFISPCFFKLRIFFVVTMFQFPRFLDKADCTSSFLSLSINSSSFSTNHFTLLKLLIESTNSCSFLSASSLDVVTYIYEKNIYSKQVTNFGYQTYLVYRTTKLTFPDETLKITFRSWINKSHFSLNINTVWYFSL